MSTPATPNPFTSPSAPPPLPAPPSRVRPRSSWWGRHWKWVVPVCCLIPIAATVGLAAAVLTALKSADVYQSALARVQTAPAVVAELGEPVTDGFFFSGNISTSGASGKADFVIPLSGPRGKATAYVESTRSLGLWRHDRLMVEISASGRRIDLSDSTDRPSP